MEKHLKIFPFLKWLSYQSCHIQRAFCRASSSNNFHIYLIDALFYLKLWSSKSKGRKLYIVTKYWNQTITMYDTCNRKKKTKKKNTVVTYHFKAALYLALSHLSQTRGQQLWYYIIFVLCNGNKTTTVINSLWEIRMWHLNSWDNCHANKRSNHLACYLILLFKIYQSQKNSKHKKSPS